MRLRNSYQDWYGLRTGQIVIALSLLAAACGSGTGEQSTATEVAPAPNETEAESTLMLGTADGGQIDWNSLEGQDVVLWFWAPW